MPQLTKTYLKTLINNDNFKSVKKLSLENKNITSLNTLLNDFDNLEELDISHNSITTLAHLKLSSLKILRCINNKISSYALAGVHNLEEIYIFGNPLDVADRFIIVQQLPKLKFIDGVTTNHMRNIIKHIDIRFAPILQSVWDKEFAQMFDREFEDDLFFQFVEKLYKYPMLETGRKFKKYKLQIMALEFLKKEYKKLTHTQSKQNDTDDESILAPPTQLFEQDLFDKDASVKSAFKILSTNSTQGLISSASIDFSLQSLKNNTLSNQNSGSLKRAEFMDASSQSPKLKRQKTSDSNNTHSTFPLEFSELTHLKHSQVSPCQVWRAAFEPDPKNKGKTTDIVATCGRNLVCFIDCSTGIELKRFFYRDTSENLFTLAWTILPSGDEDEVNTFLAIAGQNKRIYLINPSNSSVCLNFEGHSKEVAALVFSTENPTHLFSGGDDGMIHLWEIDIELFGSNLKPKLLLSFDAKLEILQMTISPSFNMLIAACEGGLLGWQIPPSYKPSIREPNIQFGFPGRNKNALFDGLVSISDNLVATKEAQSTTIQVWDLKESLGTKWESVYKRKKNFVECRSITNLDYSKECTTDYLPLNFNSEHQILMCGDDNECYWLYNLANNSSMILNWPQIENEQEPNKKFVINHLVMSQSGNYLVACTNDNSILICKARPII